MPAANPDRYLSPAETAAALGVTPRALRLYETRGLIEPLKTSAGWRAYGPATLTRLHQILALKRIGLTLAEIAILIAGRLSDLDSVLALQEGLLQQQRDQAAQGLALVRAARSRLAAGEALSLDDLTRLTKETTMIDKTPEWAVKMRPAIDRHFAETDKAALAAREGAFDQAQVNAEWEALIGEAKTLVGTDPAAPAALDLAHRWRAQVERFTGGDPELEAKAGQVWKDSMADPSTAPSLPFGPEVWAFIGRAMAQLPRP